MKKKLNFGSDKTRVLKIFSKYNYSIIETSSLQYVFILNSFKSHNLNTPN